MAPTRTSSLTRLNFSHRRVPLTSDIAENQRLLQETDELIRIFFASIRTAQQRTK
jgi:hypothetical protein